MQILKGVQSVSKEFDFFLVDIWGVIFDGNALYPGAPQALACLKASAKKVILISNASIEGHRLSDILASHGVDKTNYDDILTSGSVAQEWLETKGRQLGECYFLPNAKPHSNFYALKNLTRTDSLEQAQFLVIDSYPDAPKEREETENILNFARERGMMMVCANPDIDIHLQSGQRVLQAGKLADAFEKGGGQVIYFGKPHAPIYEIALARMGYPDSNKVCAFGDGLLTDIKGANAQDFFSVWVLQQEEPLSDRMINYLHQECERQHILPNAILSSFAP